MLSKARKTLFSQTQYKQHQESAKTLQQQRAQRLRLQESCKKMGSDQNNKYPNNIAQTYNSQHSIQKRLSLQEKDKNKSQLLLSNNRQIHSNRDESAIKNLIDSDSHLKKKGFKDQFQNDQTEDNGRALPQNTHTETDKNQDQESVKSQEITFNFCNPNQTNEINGFAAKQERNSPKKEALNLTKQMDLAVQSLSKIARKLGNPYTNSLTQIKPISKRTRKQQKIQLKAERNKKLELGNLYNPPHNQQNQQSTQQSSDQRSYKKQTNCESIRLLKRAQKQQKASLTASITIITQRQSLTPKQNIGAKKTKSLQNKDKRKKSDCKVQFEESSQTKVEQLRKENQAKVTLVQTIKEIRQLEKAHKRRTQFLVTEANGQLRILSMIDLVKGHPQDFAKYLQSRLQF